MDNVQSECKYDARPLTAAVRLKPYLVITKPGIIFGNLIATIGGFLLAARGEVNFPLFSATLSGVGLVIASGCVFNNYIDQDIDRLMQRTKNRPLLCGDISPSVSLFYATALGVCGFALLYFFTNLLTTALAAVGFVVYVIFYSLFLKRHSLYSTLIGSISGATPPVMGYCAVSGQFDLAALILLLAFSLWQMPHAFAIAIFRFQDYLAASIAILPVSRGIKLAQRYMIAYIAAFAVVCLCLAVAGYTGKGYVLIMTLLNLYWLWLAVKMKKQQQPELWARKIFIFSIIIITAFSITISVDFL